jgi:crossover junction endodeoxyribonuclease RuvC
VGYALVDVVSGGRIDYVECGVIDVRDEGGLPERLRSVADAVGGVIDEFRPGELAIELAFHGRDASSALKLGQARGAILVEAVRHGLAVNEYAPARVKLAVVGHGRATKEAVQQRVTMLCRLARPPSADASDALAIALCHALATLGGAP